MDMPEQGVEQMANERSVGRPTCAAAMPVGVAMMMAVIVAMVMAMCVVVATAAVVAVLVVMVVMMMRVRIDQRRVQLALDCHRGLSCRTDVLDRQRHHLGGEPHVLDMPEVVPAQAPLAVEDQQR